MSAFRILVVDDESSIRKLLRLQLEDAGYEVLAAPDGPTGLDIAKKENPDLILLDLMMPNMDGHEVCRRLRKNYRTSYIPVVILTAKTGIKDLLTGLGGGANDYLTKPYERDELLIRVKSVLEWSRSQREASPLTGLPGNIAIEREVTRRILERETFAFLYGDLDNFKAFNDHYGYGRGDEAIKFSASVFIDALESLNRDDGFLGHIGGDDFVVVTHPSVVEELAHDVVRKFEEGIKKFYDPQDRRKGHIEVETRQHGQEQYPLMTITLVYVSSASVEIDHYGKVSDIVTELKKHGKGIAGSVVLKERRRTENKQEVENSVQGQDSCR
jgi:diguanylate cyclase (GGDEF)-like protein